MPAVVDHNKRRRELIVVAIELIAEAGLNGASVRAIAARAGYSTMVVEHYFRNKAELLRQAFEYTIEQTERRVDSVMAGGADARAALETFLPIGEGASQTWKVWFAFWGAALGNSEYTAAQARRGREGMEIIGRVLDKCSDIPPTAAGGREMQSARLLTMIAGIAAIATFDPDTWPPNRQRATLAGELTALRAGY
ncbi:MAG: hypothetical protein RL481_120 [Pseudomonadota bacterium]|jgi:AcrR family transcriptional regulator